MERFNSNREKVIFLEAVLEKAKSHYDDSKKQPDPPFLKRLRPMLSGAQVKFFLIKLLDSSLRSSESSSINRHIQYLINKYPEHSILFNPLERGLLWAYKLVGRHFPTLSIPLLVKQIKATTNEVIFNIDNKNFKNHVKNRRNENIKQNINLIGEALLGEEEANNRITAYKELINQAEIDYISIKISTIYSQISSLAYQETLKVLQEKLRILYDESIAVAKSTGKETFINLDMEEYRDLSLTVDLFESVLSEKNYINLFAGIVLQSYIPESFHYLLRLQKWSMNRVKNGGSPIKIRIVKGANLEMEKHESSLKGWPQAPHREKLLSDAQYKRMLFQTLTKESCKSLRVGIATHNIFDMSTAICLIERYSLHNSIDIEMLEGLAENLLPFLLNQHLNVLLYTPVIKENQFLSGIAYLVRRFDEATAKGNYLRESVSMSYNDTHWKTLQDAFKASFEHSLQMEFKSYKTQNRLNPNTEKKTSFENCPDTDWTIDTNRKWANAIIENWQGKNIPIPKVFPKYKNSIDREVLSMTNWKGKLPFEVMLANISDYKEAIQEAKNSIWIEYDVDQRVSVLRKVAITLENSRGNLIGVGMAEAGKLINEMDTEISEAIDFANYYAESMLEIDKIPDLHSHTSGTNLVLSPWNFPIAIPAGGILASLAIGNTVIIKPAKRSAACCYLLVNLMYEAGVPKSALHILPCHSSEIKPLLTARNTFSSIILTGGTNTALKLMNQNPELNLFAETGGKNATIITGFADKDLAIKNVVDSAFGNAGQKCSATSLLILERSVCTAQFFQLLVDAIKSKKVGSPWDLDTEIGPLINPLAGGLKKELYLKNNWLLKGYVKSDFEVSPFVKKVISSEDSCFQNELFGPHLCVIEADNLAEAIELANSVPLGLTSGIETLNEEEIIYWKKKIQAGNLYINRGTTGAIVKRQPFGGVKLSSFGPGMKAGGKNYLIQLLNHSVKIKPNDAISYAKKSYTYWKNELFDKEVDEVKIRGQKNFTRYLKPNKVTILVAHDTLKIDLDLVKLACNILGLKYELFSIQKLDKFKNEHINILDSWVQLIDGINWNSRIRNLTKVLPQEFKLAIANRAIHVYSNTPIEHGRIELLNYLQEQSISYNYHRYGNLMEQVSD